MKKLILLIIVFLFIYPIFPKISPIPTDRVLQILGLGLLFFTPKDRKRLVRSKTFFQFYKLSFILLFLAIFAQLQTLIALDFYFIIRVINIFLELFSAYVVVWTVRWCYDTVNIGIILQYIVLAAVVQVIISSYFFVHPGSYLSYYSFLNKDGSEEEMIRTLNLLNVRFLGIGSSFFSGVIKYGVAFFSVLILPHVNRSFLTSNKLVYMLLVLLIIFGGILTSRSFFIALVLGVLMLAFYKSEGVLSFIKNNIKIFLIILLSIPAVYFVLYLFLEPTRLQRVLGFIFEVFINYFTGEGLTSSSTNRLGEMYVLPNNLQTWLLGDGRMIGDIYEYYMHTDVGYLRLIFYFGLPSTLFFIFLLFKYKNLLCKLTKNRALPYLFGAITSWLLILNFKGLAFHSYYYVLFLLCLLLSITITSNSVIKKDKV